MTQETEALSTIRDFIRWGASRFAQAGLFFGHGTDNALDEAVMLVFHVLHLETDLPLAYLDARLTRTERDEVLSILTRRIQERLPAAYLTGEAVFAGLTFSVNENVLVPRSPIAELIEAGFQPWLPLDSVSRVLDLCTGSGCIAIGCAHSLPDASVDAVDVSSGAMDVTRTNIARHGLEDRVEAIRSDLFQSLGGRRYDLIVSNPPYVSLDELSGLPPEYHREPRLGLEAGVDGLDLVKRILRESADYLEPNGVLIVEVGHSRDALEDHFPEVPFLWLDFEQGGEGVFLLTAEQLNDLNSAG
ncbi:MAG: 50S ribosomal protein L3 N(5)-glutamine methyltransferase [Gammaproteobacteria bacterium]|nr:50S ribosomal protein L3 N(5)-glutamine methyltransferase [Gammaproteobacteria bacterium]